MSSTGCRKVREIPQYSGESVRGLEQVFTISLKEFSLLYAAQRDDVTKFGLDWRHVSLAEKATLQALEDKGFLFFDTHGTQKWELTEIGRAVVENAHAVAEHMRLSRRGLAEIRAFPVRSTGTSA